MFGGGRLDVEFKAIRLALVAIQQFYRIVLPPDHGQLLVGHLELEQAGIDAQPVCDEVGLDPRFIGQNGFAVGNGDRVAEDQSSLNRRATIALGDPPIDCGRITERIGRREVETDLVVADRIFNRTQRTRPKGAEAAFNGEILVIFGVPRPGRDRKPSGELG